MSERPPLRISSDEARAVWERALEMQLEAARRQEQRALEAGAPADDDGGAPGFTPEEVAAAAQEAGIAEEFMQVALAEMQLARAEGREAEDGFDRAADRLLKDPRRALEVSRLIPAPPAKVLAALQELLPAHPYHLTFRDMVGDDPLADGILIFKVPGWTEYSAHQSSFTMAMLYGEVNLLLFTLRPGGSSAGEGASAPSGGEVAPSGAEAAPSAPEPAASTRVVIRAQLRKSRRSQLWWTTGFGIPLSVGAGTAGALAGVTLGAALPPLLAVAAALIPGAAAAGGTGAGTAWAFRKLYHWGVGKSEEALEELLGAVERSFRTEVAFRAPEPKQGGSWGWLGGGG